MTTDDRTRTGGGREPGRQAATADRALAAALGLQVPAAEPAAAARAAARFAAGAPADAWYAVEESPLGTLVAVATGRGLARLAYADHGGGPDAVLDRVAARLSPRLLEAPGRLDRVRRELDEYFAGRRTTFDLDVDWALVTPFAPARPARDRGRAVRRDDVVRAGRRGGREPARLARGRQRPGRQPRPDRRALPPRPARRRRPRRLHRRPGPQAPPPAPRGRAAGLTVVRGGGCAAAPDAGGWAA